MGEIKIFLFCWFGEPAGAPNQQKRKVRRGVFTQGVSRYAPLPWATFLSPLRGAEQPDKRPTGANQRAGVDAARAVRSRNCHLRGGATQRGC